MDEVELGEGGSKTWTHGEINCPHCGMIVNAVMAMVNGDDGPDTDGNSVTICGNCCEFSFYAKDGEGDLYLRKPTDHEKVIIARDRGAQAAHQFYKDFKKRKEGQQDDN